MSSCSIPRAWPPALGALFDLARPLGFWTLTFFALLPLAMTMALLWKTKEVILDSVFSRQVKENDRTSDMPSQPNPFRLHWLFKFGCWS